MDKLKIFFDTERLSVRSIEKSDKEAYMNLRAVTSEIAQAYQILPGFRDQEWNLSLSSITASQETRNHLDKSQEAVPR